MATRASSGGIRNSRRAQNSTRDRKLALVEMGEAIEEDEVILEVPVVPTLPLEFPESTSSTTTKLSATKVSP
ncbi:hypothetical protein HDV00_006072, partial [Rhizophlyctis rosea]